MLMRVGGCGYAAVPSFASSRGVRPWRTECGLNVLYSQRQRSAKDWGLGHGGEQLGVQELIPEPAVERLGKAVLQR